MKIKIILVFLILVIGLFTSVNSYSLTNIVSNNEKWIVKTLDNFGEVGQYSDIVVTDENIVLICYYDLSKKDLKFLSYENNEWSIEVLDYEGDVGLHSSIDADNAGNPHISYYDETNKDLKYTYWNGNNWIFEVIDGEFDVGEYTSLNLDSNGYPHISYHDDTNDDLKYARWNGNTWIIEVVESDGDTGEFSSISIDKNDNPHISYTNYEDRGLWYTYKNGDNWIFELVDSDCNVFGATEIALDLNDNPHISYYDTGAEEFLIKYAGKTNNRWIVETIDPWLWGVFLSSGTDITFDRFGRLHICYYDWGQHSINYVWKENDIWNIDVVDGWGITGMVGGYASIDVDLDGFVHISYADNYNLSLKYATNIQYSPSVPTKPSGETNCKRGEEYTYSTVSDDRDNDMIRYGWDWGDGSPVEWTDYYESGEKIYASHSWDEYGGYLVKVISEDENGFTSVYHFVIGMEFSQWSNPLNIQVSKSKITDFRNNLFFQLFIKRHKHLWG